MERYPISGDMAGPIYLYFGQGSPPPDASMILCARGKIPPDSLPLILPVPEAHEGQAVWLSSAFTGGRFEEELRALCARFPAVYLSLDPLRVQFGPPSQAALPLRELHTPSFFSPDLQCWYSSYLENGQWRVALYDTPQTLREKAQIAEQCGVTALLYDAQPKKEASHETREA